jgi:uncharacterized membrane protein YhaH (DUF805 family)
LRNDRGGEIALALAAVMIAIQLWINLALMARRLHDRGRSAWFLSALVVPVIGALWLFVELYLLRGTPGSNCFGTPTGGTQELLTNTPTGSTRYAGSGDSGIFG